MFIKLKKAYPAVSLPLFSDIQYTSGLPKTASMRMVDMYVVDHNFNKNKPRGLISQLLNVSFSF